MDTLNEVRYVISSVLQLGPRAARLDSSTPLLGAIPELDSMAVVSLLTALEDRFGIVIEDDEISAESLATLGTLASFIDAKLSS